MVINAQKCLINVRIIILKMEDAQPAQLLGMFLMMANVLILTAWLKIMKSAVRVNQTLFIVMVKKSVNIMTQIVKI